MTRVDFAAIRRDVDLATYLAGKGHMLKKVGTSHRINPCPICGHNDSFTVDVGKGTWKCFSSDHPTPDHGDAVEFEVQTEHVSLHEAVERLCNGNVASNVVAIESKDSDTEEKRPKLWSVQKNHEALLRSPKKLKWLTETRCISLDVIKDMKVGVWTPRGESPVYTLPYFDSDGSLATIKFRTADKSRIWFHKGATIPLYNATALENAREALIVEGEMDCLAALTYGFNLPVVSVPTGAGARFKDAWLASLDGISRVYLLYDADDAGHQGAEAAAKSIGLDRCYLVELPDDIKDLNEALIDGVPRPQIKSMIRNAMPCDPVLRAIESIPRNDPFGASRVRDEIVPLLAAVDDELRREDLLTRTQTKLGLKAKPMKAIRSELHRVREEAAQDQTADPPDKPAMTDEEREEALEYLKSPDLFNKIEKDLSEAACIVGERHVKMALYLVMLSRITDNPISATVLSSSSTGKSWTVEQTSKAFPPEDVVWLSSASTRSIEYASESMLSGKVVIIGEWDSLADPVLESVVRQAMSEHRVSRLTTQWKDGEADVQLNTQNIRSAWIVTSTISNRDFNVENANRTWILELDGSTLATEKVVEFTKKAQTLEWKLGAPKREERLRVLQNAQRLLKNYEVVIPFAELIEYPTKAGPRTRRDISRFLSCTRLVALSRQHRREVKQVGDLTYIEATFEDYREAFNIMAPILAGTLSELSERAKRVLRVAVSLRDTRVAAGENADVIEWGLRALAEHAPTTGDSLGDTQDLRRQIRTLVRDEWLVCTDGADSKGKAKKYALASRSLSLDDDGELVGLADALVGITTPEELQAKLEDEDHV